VPAIPIAGPAMTWTLAAVTHRHRVTPAATGHMIDYVFDLSLYSRKFASP